MPHFLHQPLLLAATTALLFFSCASEAIESNATPATLPPAQSLSFDYIVGPGDVLRVNVAGHPDLSSAPYKQNMIGSPVDGRGDIQLPYIGCVSVAGKTVFDIKTGVEDKLKKYLKRPLADVAVIEFNSHRIYVLGEVRQPGMFTLDRPMTALQALTLTGGFTDDANREQIALVRGSVNADNIVVFDAEHLTAGGDFALAANDMVFVGRHKWAGVGAVARDLVPILQLISVPVGTARDVALFQDIRDR
ncbi:MAG: polysaccharide biosynthesis/export family protein [Planctomycetota bacterium]|nr:polysaccharide biosynthesis/export family protein [Planctomycetota bacterium]